jgi:hypothetical protein
LGAAALSIGMSLPAHAQNASAPGVSAMSGHRMSVPPKIDLLFLPVSKRERIMRAGSRCRHTIILSGILFFSITARSQTIIRHLAHLEPPQHSGKEFPLEDIPFGTIRVLDSRPDTTFLFYSESGSYPPEETSFDTTTAVAIEQYLNELAGRLKKKGRETLVINLRELYMPNQRFVLRRVVSDLRVLGITQRKAGSSWYFDERSRIEFAADVFYQLDGGHYMKLFSVQNEYFYSTYFKQVIEAIFNELLQTASIAYENSKGRDIKAPKWFKELLKDTSVYRKDLKDSAVSLQEVQKKAREKWMEYPIMHADGLSSGVFRNFDDFRDNKLLARPIQLRFDDKDSVYRIVLVAGDPVSHQKAWAISDSRHLYIQVAQNAYLLLQRTDSGFSFVVPRSMPDMYALLSIMEERADRRIDLYGTSGNLFADMAALTAIGVAEGERKSGRQKTIIAEGLKHDFRRCTINLDNGDILYRPMPAATQNAARSLNDGHDAIAHKIVGIAPRANQQKIQPLP